jgi:hypothetical protein
MTGKARCSAMVLPLHETTRRHCPLECSNGQRCSADRESETVPWVTLRSTWHSGPEDPYSKARLWSWSSKLSPFALFAVALNKTTDRRKTVQVK